LARHGTRILVGEAVRVQLEPSERPVAYAVFRGPVRLAVALPLVLMVAASAVGLFLVYRAIWPTYLDELSDRSLWVFVAGFAVVGTLWVYYVVSRSRAWYALALTGERLLLLRLSRTWQTVDLSSYEPYEVSLRRVARRWGHQRFEFRAGGFAIVLTARNGREADAAAELLQAVKATPAKPPDNEPEAGVTRPSTAELEAAVAGTKLKVTCRKCGRSYRYEVRHSGRHIVCPWCRFEIRLP
jgi:hypothetical protein